jgi:hypothetical protein
MDGFTDMLKTIEDWERYAHCLGQGQRFAETQCPCLEERVINYTHLAGIQTGMDTDFSKPIIYVPTPTGVQKDKTL